MASAREQDLDQAALSQQHEKGHAERDDALEIVDHPAGGLLAEFVGEVSRQRHAEGIHRDRDRNRRADEQDLDPEDATFEEMSEHDAEGDERHQAAQATAGFVDEELGMGEVDDVALDQRGDADLLQAQHRHLGRDQLERKGDRIHERLGQGHHQEEEEEREGQDLEDLAPEQQQDEADQAEDECAAHRHQLGAEPADRE